MLVYQRVIGNIYGSTSYIIGNIIYLATKTSTGLNFFIFHSPETRPAIFPCPARAPEIRPCGDDSP
jgi:hypothetical protein